MGIKSCNVKLKNIYKNNIINIFQNQSNFHKNNIINIFQNQSNFFNITNIHLYKKFHFVLLFKIVIIIQIYASTSFFYFPFVKINIHFIIRRTYTCTKISIWSYFTNGKTNSHFLLVHLLFLSFCKN